MDLGGYVLGQNDELLQLRSAEENHAVALALISQAKREITIMSYDLESEILSRRDIVDAFSAFVRQSRYAKVRILVQNSRKIVTHGHRIIPLAHRLSSSISLNKPAYEHRDVFEAYMIVDGIGYYKRLLADRFDGVANFKAPIEGRDLKNTFNTMWEVSEPDPQLRRLQI